MTRRESAAETVLTVARSAYEHDIQYPAAAFAYYAFVSLIPLLVVLLVVGGEPVTGPIRDATARFLTPKARQLVSNALANSAGKAGATLFAAGVLVWSAANVTAGVEAAVGRVEQSAGESVSRRLREVAGVLVSLGLGACSVVAASALFVLLPGALPAAAGLGFLFVALSLVLLPLYYLPTSELSSPASALPGTLTTAAGWTALLAGVRFYVAHAATFAVYGVLSVILLVLTSLYVAAVVLMLGFVVNATVSGEGGPASSA